MTLQRAAASILKAVRNSAPAARWLAALAVGLSILVWLALRAALEPVEICPEPCVETRPEYKIGLLAGLAALFFILGVSGVRWSLRQRSGLPAVEDRRFETLAFFSAAFLPPLLALMLPGWIIARFPVPLTGADIGRMLAWLGASLTTGQPWFTLWQGLVFSTWGLTKLGQGKALGERNPGAARARSSWAALAGLGLLAGLLLWLVSIFLFSLLGRSLVLPNPLYSPLTRAAAVFAGLVLAPLGEEYAFRRVLRQRWQSALAVSILYAALQLRPLLWIPAFVLAAGLDALVQRTGRLAPAVAAHALFNLLMLSLNAAWIL